MPTRNESGPRQIVVLLVEPDDDGRAMYVEFLQLNGVVTIAVANTTNAAVVAPTADIIVTGIMLEGFRDGLDLVAELRASDRTKHLPIIVLTACALNMERERARRAGCDVFLSKPCLPTDLLFEIRRLVAATNLHGLPRRRNLKANIAAEPRHAKTATPKRRA